MMARRAKTVFSFREMPNKMRSTDLYLNNTTYHRYVGLIPEITTFFVDLFDYIFWLLFKVFDKTFIND